MPLTVTMLCDEFTTVSINCPVCRVVFTKNQRTNPTTVRQTVKNESSWSVHCWISSQPMPPYVCLPAWRLLFILHCKIGPLWCHKDKYLCERLPRGYCCRIRLAKLSPMKSFGTVRSYFRLLLPRRGTT